MILEKIGLDKESRQERNIKKIVEGHAGRIALELANSKGPKTPWTFNIGSTPETITVMNFAQQVGETTLKKLTELTSLEIAKYNPTETGILNTLKPGIGEAQLDTVPPPDPEINIVFDRTPVGKAYNF